jgi:hypothetical protein
MSSDVSSPVAHPSSSAAAHAGGAPVAPCLGIEFYERHRVRIKVGGRYRYHTSMRPAEMGLAINTPIEEIAVWNGETYVETDAITHHRDAL